MIKRTTIYLLIILTGIILAKLRVDSLLENTVPVPPPRLPVKVNALKLNKGSADTGHIKIKINSPIELDGLLKKDVFDLRQSYVADHSDLVDGIYRPHPAVFGSIIDKKPWWGLRGQFCYGNGQRSIDGLSEESRFIANPFHLLYLDEMQAFKLKTGCSPVYAMPSRLFWSKNRHMAVAKYDMGAFFNKKKAIGLPSWTTTFTVDRTNAVDFGYNYMMIDPELSTGVEPAEGGRLFDEPCRLRSFIHLGKSCGYPGGCNNSSPFQGYLYFQIDDLPARIVCRLWKKRPIDADQPADFIFIFELY